MTPIDSRSGSSLSGLSDDVLAIVATQLDPHTHHVFRSVCRRTYDIGLFAMSEETAAFRVAHDIKIYPTLRWRIFQASPIVAGAAFLRYPGLFFSRETPQSIQADTSIQLITAVGFSLKARRKTGDNTLSSFRKYMRFTRFGFEARLDSDTFNFERESLVVTKFLTELQHAHNREKRKLHLTKCCVGIPHEDPAVLHEFTIRDILSQVIDTIRNPGAAALPAVPVDWMNMT